MSLKDPDARKVYNTQYHQNYDKGYYQDNKTHIVAQRAERRRELSRWFREEIKAKLKCTRCPEDFWACIEFHHEDPNQKEFTVGDMARRGFSKQKILAEIAKCIVLCSNCHKKEHAKSFDVSVV